jgi:hypothetical protein
MRLGWQATGQNPSRKENTEGGAERIIWLLEAETASLVDKGNRPLCND